MAETLPGLKSRPTTIDDEYRDGAVRAIREVISGFMSDRDKVTALVKSGGNLPEMRAAVDAARLYNEIINGLELAIDRVLGHSDEEVHRA